MKRLSKIILMLVLFIATRVYAATNTLLIDNTLYYLTEDIVTEYYSFDYETSTLKFYNFEGFRIETTLPTLYIDLNGEITLEGDHNLITGNDIYVTDGCIFVKLTGHNACAPNRLCDQGSNLFYANNLYVDDIQILADNEYVGYSIFRVENTLEVKNTYINSKNKEYIVSKANDILFDNVDIYFDGYIMFDYLSYGSLTVKNSYIEGDTYRFVSCGGPYYFENSYLEIYASEVFTFSGYVPVTLDGGRMYISNDNYDYKLFTGDLDEYVNNHYLIILDPGYVLINGMVVKEEDVIVEAQDDENINETNDSEESDNNEIIDDKSNDNVIINEDKNIENLNNYIIDNADVKDNSDLSNNDLVIEEDKIDQENSIENIINQDNENDIEKEELLSESNKENISDIETINEVEDTLEELEDNIIDENLNEEINSIDKSTNELEVEVTNDTVISDKLNVTKNPKTKDNLYFIIPFFIISFISLIGFFIYG